MTRAKRDSQKRAFKQGYNQGVKGHSSEMCPYGRDIERGLWLGGWRQGHEDHVAGFRNHMSEAV